MLRPSDSVRHNNVPCETDPLEKHRVCCGSALLPRISPLQARLVNAECCAHKLQNKVKCDNRRLYCLKQHQKDVNYEVLARVRLSAGKNGDLSGI